MKICADVSLKPYNTFGIDLPAKNLACLARAEDLPTVAAQAEPVFILGSGSNILLTAPVEGLVVLNQLKGIELIGEDDAHVWLKAAAGEAWHSVVLFAIAKGWGGIENLALIPGTVGASPMQNIGAYGAEVKDVIHEVTYWHWGQKCFATVGKAACQFGYRDSIFKHELKGQVMITEVVYRLCKQPQINTQYGAIMQQLALMDVVHPTVADVAAAVMHIRRSKLPDPAMIGNAGSFFKNPVITTRHFDQLLLRHTQMPHYESGPNHVKIPAAWLIEQCGWKGYRRGDAGVHSKQLLVLVNYGAATGAEILALADEVIHSVQQSFGIALEREVQVW